VCESVRFIDRLPLQVSHWFGKTHRAEPKCSAAGAATSERQLPVESDVAKAGTPLSATVSICTLPWAAASKPRRQLCRSSDWCQSTAAVAYRNGLACAEKNNHPGMILINAIQNLNLRLLVDIARLWADWQYRSRPRF
jgi:hypothetical protein